MEQRHSNTIMLCLAAEYKRWNDMGTSFGAQVAEDINRAAKAMDPNHIQF